MRALTFEEAWILKRLLELPFAGQAELREQLEGLEAEPVDEFGTLELRPRAGRTSHQDGCVAEAYCDDPPSSPILILLHVKDGRLWMLEFVKQDGSDVRKPPTADRLRDFFTAFPIAA